MRRLSATLIYAMCVGIVGHLIQADALAESHERRHFQPADIHRIKNVDDAAISPEGDWIAYVVGETDAADDETFSNLYMVDWDGETRLQMTHEDDGNASHPRFSPDGKYLAFIASRGDDEDSDDPATKAQVWILHRAGGEASRLTEFEGGVSAFEWSPDSSRLVVVSKDPEEGAEAEDESGNHSETEPPIVIDRYQFKRDIEGYLGNRYKRLYLFDIDSRDSALLTEGAFDSDQPAWSPDGERIVFRSRRDGDPDRHYNSDIYVIDAEQGATPRQLTTWEGPDSDPVFSPDGESVAYLQDGPPKYNGYDPNTLAIISLNGGDPVLPASDLDRNMASPRWSVDGKSVYFRVTDDRIQAVASVAPNGGEVSRIYPESDGVVKSFQVGANGVVTVTSFGDAPPEIYRASDGMALSDHNATLLDEITWASVEGFDSVGPDGVEIGSMLLKPPGYREGVAYPTIAYVHGGPYGQDGFEFDATSQMLAAQGYLVVNPNYRGSSGRSREFSRAIYADWGNLEIQDIHAVMDHLVEEGLADPDRLGIGGWSYGGMSTNYAIATDTRFKAAVSGASISNAITGYGTDQYIRQYENEIGLPWESIDPYLKISYPFFQADRIKTPTLFMCGEKDFNVPLINSEQMYQALRSLGVPTQLVIYPAQYHSIKTPSYVQDRLERMIDWYGDYLGPGVK